MRCLLLLLCACLCATASEDPFTGFRFSDGITRSLSDLRGDGVLLVYACGHCPGAGERLDTLIAPLAKSANEDHRPFSVVVATPDHADDALREWAKNHSLDRCLVATDTRNALDISLKNIWQVRAYDAKGEPQNGVGGSSLKELLIFAAAHGQHRLPVPGLTDSKVTELWWAVERRRTKAVPALLAAAKAKSPQKAQLDLVVAAVRAEAEARQAALIDAPADLATVEGSEALLGECEGLDLKPARDRLKALLKDKALKAELEARTIWRTCQVMVGNPRVNVQKEGRANLAELAKRFPDTVYGRKAAAP